MQDSRVELVEYNHTPVYEQRVNGIEILMRKKDSWVHATRLLRAANIKKPESHRILEDVDRDDFQQIQGGTPKFQGSWVSFPVARKMANDFGLARQLKAMFDLSPLSNSGVVPTLSFPPTVQINEPRPVRSRPSIAQPTRTFPPHSAPPMHLVPRPNFVPQPHLTPPSMGLLPNSPPAMNPLPIVGQKLVPPPHAHPPQPPRSPSYPPPPDLIKIAKENKGMLDALVHAGQGQGNPSLTLPTVSDINAGLDTLDNTALHYAAAYGLSEIVKGLMAKGANTNTRNAQGQTPLMLTCRTTGANQRSTFPHLFISLAEHPTPQTRFALAWAHDNDGNTLLHHIVLLAVDQPDAAAAYARPLLIALQHDAQGTNTDAKQPQRMVALLNAQNAVGQTALFLAAFHQLWAMCDQLIKAGANSQVADLRGVTPATLLQQR